MSKSSSPTCLIVFLPCITSLASKSMLSIIFSNVALLPVIFITGAIIFPVGVPLPVEKIITVAPPATIATTDATSKPGESITKAPFLVGICEYLRTSTTGRVPPLCMQPRDFSSIVERPPSLFPGEGLPDLKSWFCLARWSSRSLQSIII
ncbi:hypothetical protein SDC9_205700 [bioreactor metagenome]|uniref:Uncharacterized protein n=1 Tax=bioreactor metagenome TaxID=1076179 RepID=A0A645JC84_9ZZZZ